MGDSKKLKVDPKVDFVAGTAGGIAGIAVGHPFDTVKVRFQSPETASKYRSTLHAFALILKEEGLRGLYKGVLSPMLSAAPLNGMIFASYRFFMRAQVESDDALPTISQVFWAGAGSGIVSTWITCPIELIKIRQQNIIDAQPSTKAVALDIFRTRGIRGLYRGITSTLLRDAGGYGAYFATYEWACRYFSRPVLVADSPTGELKQGHLSIPALLTAGAAAGISGWAATFAFDVVKTRVQGVDIGPFAPLTSASSNSLTSYANTFLTGSPSLTPAYTPALARGVSTNASSTAAATSPPPARSLRPHPYATTYSTIVNSYRAEGPRVFFRGISPTLLRAVPVNMATFGVFELFVYILS